MSKKTAMLVMTAFFAALTALGAFLKFQVLTLPLTLQPVFAVLAGLLLGTRWGAASQALYLLLGLSGLPVFAKGGGVWYVFEPSFGFIMGFVACAAVSGAVNAAGKGRAAPYAAAVLGLVSLYIVGCAYMYILLNMFQHKHGVNMLYIVSNAVFPYIIKDFALFMAAAAVSKRLAPALRRR